MLHRLLLRQLVARAQQHMWLQHAWQLAMLFCRGKSLQTVQDRQLAMLEGANKQLVLLSKT